MGSASLAAACAERAPHGHGSKGRGLSDPCIRQEGPGGGMLALAIIPRLHCATESTSQTQRLKFHDIDIKDAP